MNKLKTAIATVLCAGLAMPVTADILELKSGDLIEGSFAGGSQNSVRFNVNGKLEVFKVGDVMSITFTGAPSGGSASQVASAPQAVAPAPAAPVQVAKAPVEIPAGTPFMIRTRSTLDSGKVGTGAKFTGVLEANLVSNGVVIAERGDTVYGQVVDAKKSGRVAGSAHISVSLTGIMINGVVEPIATNTITFKGESTTGSTVGNTLGAAVIGGLIDGKSGARTGAKVGAGASILTSGNQVVVKAGTILDFQFKVPLRIQ